MPVSIGRCNGSSACAQYETLGAAGDKARRRAAAADKAAKLKSPNFCVSATRLHLANIPKTVDEKALKQLLLEAV